MISLLLAVIYLSFISLGLPDSLLGSAWPVMYEGMHSTITGAGTLAMLISICTIVSSLMSDRMIGRFGTGKVTAFSVLTTAIALFGFSISTAYWHLVLWCIPYGLGAGAVDAALNNYVSLHFKARHMSWLHCMWGIGASAGPFIMGAAINHTAWNDGYRIISIIQIVLTAVIFLSLPLWKGENQGQEEENRNVVPLKDAIKLPGAKAILIAFFCYCAAETSTGLWAASWMVSERAVSAETAASLASLFYLGITAGRAISGFISEKLGDQNMIRLGEGIALAGILCLLPHVQVLSFIGLVCIGLGCAPIYPAIIHSTPARFGPENSQSLTGIEMACAYMGSTFAPKLLGLLSDVLSLRIYPLFLLVIVVLMVFMTENSGKNLKKEKQS
jgi:fucose permease